MLFDGFGRKVNFQEAFLVKSFLLEVWGTGNRRCAQKLNTALSGRREKYNKKLLTNESINIIFGTKEQGRQLAAGDARKIPDLARLMYLQHTSFSILEFRLLLYNRSCHLSQK